MRLRYNIWPYLKKHTAINPWKAEEKILKMVGISGQAKFQQGEKVLLDFSRLKRGAFGIKMSWKEDIDGTIMPIYHEVELTSIIIKDQKYLNWLKKHFNGLTPIFAVDIIVDGKSIINTEG